MRRLLFTIGFLLLLYAVQAQSATDTSFTLQECIDYALKNNPNILNAELDKEIANAKVRETKALGYPSITGNVSLVDNPNLPRMFFAMNNPFATAFSAPGSNTSNVKQSGDVLVMKNLFQLRSSGDANAQLNQLLFDGSYIVGLQTASTYRELSQKGSTQTKIQTTENITKAYYAILISEESTKLFDVNIHRMDSSLNQLRISHKNGLVEEIDVKRLEVQYNNLLTDKQNAENLLALGKLQLKLNMGMPIDQGIVLADSLNSFSIDPQPLPEEAFNPKNRIEYSLLETQQKLSQLDLKRYKFSRFPTIVALAKGGYNRSDVQFGNLFANQWFNYTMLGLGLTVPILDFKRHYQIQQAKYASQKYRYTLQNASNGFQLEVTSARLNYNNSIKSMQNQKRNMELAQEVVRVTRIKYQEGIGSNLEVVNAEADLQAAQINYYRALYDAILAKINYKKATGTLYNGQ